MEPVRLIPYAGEALRVLGESPGLACPPAPAQVYRRHHRVLVRNPWTSDWPERARWSPAVRGGSASR